MKYQLQHTLIVRQWWRHYIYIFSSCWDNNGTKRIIPFNIVTLTWAAGHFSVVRENYRDYC